MKTLKNLLLLIILNTMPCVQEKQNQELNDKNES